MAIVADASIARARQALKQIGGRSLAAQRTCLACGRPLGREPSVRLHGDQFHERCARYRRGLEKA
jgi:hypothetical protein